MKKTKYLVSLFLLMCILGSSLAYAAGGTMKLAQVSEKNTAPLTYLRTQPSDNASVTFGYNKGVFLMILSEDTNGWCYVSIGNQQGYMKKTELSTDNVTTAKAGYPVSTVHPATPKSWVNFRETPTLDAKVISKLYTGDSAFILGSSDEWIHVMVGDQTGFIKAEFLDDSGYKTALSFMDIEAPLSIIK